MKIAVPFEDGQVFQHFGRSAQFKFYEAENGQLLRTEVIPTNGQGHGALAGFLVQHGADVVLCGGIGTGAQAALMQAGIQLFGGLSGAEQLDAGLHQRCLRTGADAAAEHDICAMLYEKARQCAVALTVRRDDLGAQELAVFGLIELELCGAAKVLEHLTVFEWDCDFHENVSFTADFVQPPGCFLPAFWRPEA